MALLFLLALLLAWPTFGLSLLAWFALGFYHANVKVAAGERRRKVADDIGPLFKEKHDEFYKALDIPYLTQRTISDDDAMRCGRHIMNYIAHNPHELKIFMSGLQRWKTKGSYEPCDAITAATCENDYNAKGEIHLTSYRAIEALVANNPNLKCFSSVNLSRLAKYISSLETRGLIAA